MAVISSLVLLVVILSLDNIELESILDIECFLFFFNYEWYSG